MFKIPRECIKHEPWITTGLLTSSRTKSKQLHIKLRQPTEQNTIKYKQYINKYNEKDLETRIFCKRAMHK